MTVSKFSMDSSDILGFRTSNIDGFILELNTLRIIPMYLLYGRVKSPKNREPTDTMITVNIV